MKLKKLVISIFLVFCATIFGCKEKCTICENPPIADDQQFTVDENVSSFFHIGTINAEASENAPLTYNLLNTFYSESFFLEESTGKLFVKDSSIIDYETVQNISLEALVAYASFYVSATLINIEITINDVEEFNMTQWESQSNQVSSSYVNNIEATSNYAAANLLFCSAWTANLEDQIHRSFIKFDLSEIPQGLIVKNAQLLLFNPKDDDPGHQHSELEGDNDFYVSNVLTAWDENTIQWNNQPMYNRLERILVPKPLTDTSTVEIDVSTLVQSMISSPESNFGFAIYLATEERYRRLCFCSEEFENPMYTPCLKIKFHEE